MTRTETLPRGSLLDLVKRGYVERQSVLAIHEAGHAAVALYFGLGVTLATIDPDGPHVQLDEQREHGWPHLWTTMAGPIATGDGIKWRPKAQPAGATGWSDDAALALLVITLGLNESDWIAADRATRELLELSTIARARSAISAHLLERGSLDGDELRRLFAGEALTELEGAR